MVGKGDYFILDIMGYKSKAFLFYSHLFTLRQLREENTDSPLLKSISQVLFFSDLRRVCPRLQRPLILSILSVKLATFISVKASRCINEAASTPSGMLPELSWPQQGWICPLFVPDDFSYLGPGDMKWYDVVGRCSPSHLLGPRRRPRR